MNTYTIIIDDVMIRNMLQTNIQESFDLLTPKLILYFLFLGLLPSFFIYKINLKDQNLKELSIAKLKVIFSSLLIILLLIFAFSKHYASFFREHKSLRKYINPTAWIYATGLYAKNTYTYSETVFHTIGKDATIDKNTTRNIVIMVVGEAARADHFSINGYKKETNPLLKKEDIINLSQVSACGTSTAVSVPCMFSKFPKDSFDYKKGIYYENVLDVLNHTDNVAVLWRDNNSNSKGVAVRLQYQHYKAKNNNTICDNGECRDEGMLVGLDEYIEKNKDKNILIVLHQMGNHGPAYYKRYPKEFEKFTPVCSTNQLENCSAEEISNAYDNALLYTDYFLTQTINFLKQYENKYNTSLIYMSDHGESLGENGVYLHGLPYFIAPDAQTHVPAFLWFGTKSKESLDVDKIRSMKDKEFSHDNLFHTLLGIFNVKSEVYDQKMDIINQP